MLQIQRASAGSGKTFALARKFILLLISIRDEGATRRRLRKKPELEDAARHILAVTFTNAATHEMKQRIVSRLADLASDKPADEVDYLDFFCNELDATEGQVRSTCRQMLSILLHNYSEFHVSTIDSFFQTVLRTFAYEADLNDTYELELDSKLVGKMGVDATIDNMADDTPDEEVKFWLEMKMSETVDDGNKWNIFQRRTGRGSLYEYLLDMAAYMESEQYKRNRLAIERYFDEHPDLVQVFKDCENVVLAKARKALETLRACAKKCLKYVADAKIPQSDLRAHLAGHLDKSANMKLDSKEFGYVSNLKAMRDGKTVFASNAKRANDKALAALCLEFYNALDEFFAERRQSNFRVWQLCRTPFADLGLLKAMRSHSQSFLRENNMLELGETNSLLATIIGDDDTPFIYERLGSKLDHFLIDEFQDTSAMQWNNLRPLLRESLSRECDNLIIGDAKQSIYRFRNAEPSLITSVVPGEFPRHRPLGKSPAENTNHRSSELIVKFNNSLYAHLPRLIDGASGTPEGEKGPLETLYDNVVQPVADKNRKGRGYVCVASTLEDPEKAVPDINATPTESFARLGDIITDALRRGYKQSDIAILVNTNNDGRLAVRALIEYNEKLRDDAAPIAFISPESLLVNSAASVSRVISILRLICKGRTTITRTEEEDAERRGIADSDDMGCNFNFYALRHPEKSRAQALRDFLGADQDFSALQEMLGGQQCTALPALVENIIATFTDADLREKESPFLAAFQDNVIEYCRRYTTDIGSFLEWWDKESGKISINSPEGTDAVSIMTIHKSKGLEYKVVIIPRLKVDFGLSKLNETEWLPPRLSVDMELPPVLPLDVCKEMADIPAYADDYARVCHHVRMDLLNKVYVATTRAVDELHLFLQIPKSGTNNLYTHFCGIVPHLADRGFAEPDLYLSETMVAIPTPDDDAEEPANIIVEVGTPGAPEKKDEEEKEPEIMILDYSGNPHLPLLQYKEADASTKDEEEEEEEPEEDPRSIGKLMHRIMENIITPADLGPTLKSMSVKGLISKEGADEIRRRLETALANPEAEKWFDGSWQVINERRILKRGIKAHIPDRIMIDPAGNAVIVDYKFGEIPDSNKYDNQVRDYMRLLLATGRVRSVKGYVWYVVKETIKEVGF